MNRLLLLAGLLLGLSPLAAAQIQLTGTANTQDFAGFTAAGIASSPAAGQLNSNDFSVQGLPTDATAATAFGANPTDASLARGVISGDPTSAGIYYTDFGGSPAIIFQPTGGGFSPGSFYVRYQNATGSTIADIGSLTYQIVYRNNATRANSFNSAYAVGACAADPTAPTYTALSALDFTSPEASDALGFVSADRSTAIAGVNLANGDCFYLRFTSNDVSGGGSRDEIGLGEIVVDAGGAVTEAATVTFDPITGTVEEGNVAPVTVVYTLINSDGNETNNPAVSGGITVTSGNGDQVTFGGTFTFGATTLSGATSTYNVTAVDDGDYTGTRNVVFGFDGVTGGSSSGTFTLTITDDEPPPPVPTNIVISEIDADQTGTDNAEFVELYDGGVGNTSLSGLVLVLINGNGNVSYGSFDLDGQLTDAEGFFVVCSDAANVPNCDLDVSPNTNLLQNGPDVVALYVGDATGWPTGTAATTSNLVDAVAYGLTNARDDAMLAAIGETVQFQEGYNGNSAGESLQRLGLFFGVATRSGGLPTTTGLLYPADPTPGAANATSFTVDATPSVTPGAGWRMLSTPLYNNDFTAIRVDDLAGINLVQGIPAGAPSTLYPAQYPSAGANLFSSYTGTNVYASPTGTDAELNPGQGFYWYFYDQDITPDPGSFGGGTSVSYALDNPTFSLSWSGIPLDDEWNGVAPSILHPVTADGFYMSGNPFAYPVRLGGVSASSGTLSSVFNVWDPAGAAGAGSYTLLTANFGTPSAGDALPPWNGVFAEITGASAPLDISVTSAAVDPTTSQSLVGRSASPDAAERRLAFSLTGTLASGAAVGDEAAMVRFLDGGTLGWDAHDGSKLRPLQSSYALLAPVGERDGAPHVQAARSLPETIADDVTMPLAVWASGSGSFSLTWDRAAFPAEWSALLLDTVTGTTVNLQTQDSYAFSSGATGAWTNRFALTVSPRIVATEGGAEADAFVGSVFPNPTAGAASLTLQPAASGRVIAAVYDALGRQVAVAFDGDVQAGAETRVDLPTAMAPGVYVVRVAGETFAQTRRFVVTR